MENHNSGAETGPSHRNSFKIGRIDGLYCGKVQWNH